MLQHGTHRPNKRKEVKQRRFTRNFVRSDTVASKVAFFSAEDQTTHGKLSMPFLFRIVLGLELQELGKIIKSSVPCVLFQSYLHCLTTS